MITAQSESGLFLLLLCLSANIDRNLIAVIIFSIAVIIFSVSARLRGGLLSTDFIPGDEALPTI